MSLANSKTKEFALLFKYFQRGGNCIYLMSIYWYNMTKNPKMTI